MATLTIRNADSRLRDEWRRRAAGHRNFMEAKLGDILRLTLAMDQVQDSTWSTHTKMAATQSRNAVAEVIAVSAFAIVTTSSGLTL